jgi:hypothetical protein
MKAKKNKRQRSEQIQQVSAGLRDLLGMSQWRKEHPKATWAEIEAAVDEQMNQVRAQLLGSGTDGREPGLAHAPRARASAVCDLRRAALGTGSADALHPNDRRTSRQADAHLWHLPRVWGGLFSPSMSS